jgi:hypothetical protein
VTGCASFGSEGVRSHAGVPGRRCGWARSGVESRSGGTADVNRIAACLTRYDLHESVTYQPASHYWPLQWYETGIFLALAAALSAICFWRVGSRQN